MAELTTGTDPALLESVIREILENGGGGGAPLDSPAFVGVPTAPTAAFGTDTTQLATTEFVQDAVTGGIAGVASFNTRTGAVTLTAGDISFAQGGTSVLVGGALGTPTSGSLVNCTGLPAAGGGTGQSTYAVGDLLQATGSTTLSKLAAVATGNVLISGGVTTASSWGKVGLTTHVSGTLPEANGGTGITALGSGVGAFLGTPSSANLAAAVTGETGTGALVFATSPTLVTPVLGTPAGGDLRNCTADGTSAVGYRNIPQNAKTGSYTLLATDLGKSVPNTTGGWTVNNSVFSGGDCVVLYNNSGSDQTITQGSGVTLRLAGTATTGSRTLAQRGIATLYFNSASDVACSGPGVT